MASCTHLDRIEVTELPESVDGCEECLESGDPWLHLRICLECGKVGCCDSSPNRHASRHAREAAHPLIRSLEPIGGRMSLVALSLGHAVLEDADGVAAT